MRDSGLTWSWEGGVSPAFSGGGSSSTAFSGWVGIVTIGIVAGLVSGVAEALGEFCVSCGRDGVVRGIEGTCKSGTNADLVSFALGGVLDLGSVDDNLTLPIITGGCLWGLFKVLGWLGGVFA